MFSRGGTCCPSWLLGGFEIVEAKHGFIDDNPYLVYSPDAEATASGSGGGGAGFPVIETDSKTGALSVTAGELAEMLENNLVLISFKDDGIIQWYQLIEYIESGYLFKAFSIGKDGSSLSVMTWAADSLNDYPTPYQG